MKNRILLFTATVLFSGIAIASSRKYDIAADFSGFTNDTVVLRSVPLAEYAMGEDNIRRDTLLLSNGVLRTSVETAGPPYFRLHVQQLTDSHGDYPPTSCIQFFLDPNERISIRGTLEDGWVRTSVEGSQFNRDLSDFGNGLNPTAAELGRMQTRLIYDPTARTDTALRASYRACDQKM